MNASQIIPSEYNPYYKRYIDLVAPRPLYKVLEEGMETTAYFFENIPQNKLEYRYQPEKWTPKDILQHISDTERVFSYRALYFSRFKNAVLEGFDENIFANNTRANECTISDLLDEYISIRKATLTLFKNFDKNQLKKSGIANGSNMSVRALGFVTCGHEIHHCNVIKERYL